MEMAGEGLARAPSWNPYVRMERVGQKPDRATGLQLSACPVASRRGEGWKAAETLCCVTAWGEGGRRGKGGSGGAMNGEEGPVGLKLGSSKEICSVIHSKSCLMCILPGGWAGPFNHAFKVDWNPDISHNWTSLINSLGVQEAVKR